PLTGAVMVSLGAVFGSRTRIVVSTFRGTPAASATLAVMVWLPTLRSCVKAPPVPSGPSRLEVHWRRGVRSPSSASVAVAANANGLAGGERIPWGGGAGGGMARG